MLVEHKVFTEIQVFFWTIKTHAMSPKMKFSSSITLGLLVFLEICSLIYGYAGFEDKRIRGVNLGGWLVLEKWIRPSVFANLPSNVEDEYTLCQNLGKTEAEKRLRANWESWVTEQDIISYKNMGINHVRIPLGYWAFDIKSGEPWVSGSWESSKKAVVWCKKQGIKVMLTLHGAPGSQNGQDHSGRKGDIKFFNDDENLQRATAVVKQMAQWANSSEWRDTVTIIQVLNEPNLWGSDYNFRLGKLKEYYKMAYDAVRQVNNKAVVAFHDAFIDPKNWYYLGEDGHYDKNVMLDTHSYQVFTTEFQQMSCANHEKVACRYRSALKEANGKLWTVVGEWSLATPRNCDGNRATLAKQQIGVWEANSSGSFFWAHKNEQNWYSWSLEDSYRLKWINPNTTYLASC